MKWIGVLAAAAVLASPAAARPNPQAAQIRLLEKQVILLQQQVAQLRIDLTTERNWRLCDYALVQDSFRLAIFPALDNFSKYLAGQGVPAWEQIQRFDDAGACAAVGVSRP